MKRNYEISQYVDTVRSNEDFFRNYYFHSIIDLNLVKLDYILKYGLLSRKNIEEKKLISFYLHSIRSYDCKNGNDYISLVDYDRLYKVTYEKEPTFSQLFEAFSLHTLTSLSLIIDRNIEVNEVGILESCFDDEVFTYDSIDKSHIKGIILPEHLTDKSICDIPFLPGDYYCYSEKNINHLLDCMELYFGKNIYREELLMSVKQAWNICYEEYRRSDWITSAVKTQKEKYGTDMKDVLSKIMNELWQEKLKIENPTYIDVVSSINNDVYPVYEIGQKVLKKIN